MISREQRRQETKEWVVTPEREGGSEPGCSGVGGDCGYSGHNWDTDGVGLSLEYTLTPRLALDGSGAVQPDWAPGEEQLGRKIHDFEKCNFGSAKRMTPGDQGRNPDKT